MIRLYPHFTVQKSGDLWSVTALVALERSLDSSPLLGGQHLVGGEPALLLWQCLTGHRWLTPARYADVNVARSVRAYLQAMAVTPGGWNLAWHVARDWGYMIWPGLVRPKDIDATGAHSGSYQ